MKRKAAADYPLIPEGEQVVRIKSVDDSKYNKFGKLTIVVEDAAGTPANVNFNFTNDDGSDNNMADFVYTKLARAALNDQTLDEIDDADLPGKYLTIEIVHNEGSRGGTFANVGKIIGPADGFPGGAKPRADKPAAAKSAAPVHHKTATEILAEAKARRAAAAKK